MLVVLNLIPFVIILKIWTTEGISLGEKFTDENLTCAISLRLEKQT